MKDESKGWVIPFNDRKPHLEEKVTHHLATIPTLPKNERKPIRSRMPDSSDPIEQEMWCREEFRRIKEGHFGMSGKMYFWYNYVKMDDAIEGGIIRPNFMVCQQYWFDEIQKAQESREWGLIGVKRRQIGASWLESSDILHDAITLPNTKYGMTSKSEEDAVKLFKKVKFIYDNLPDWLRPSTSSNSRMLMDFSYKVKDSKGNWIRRGLRSEIQVKAPTDTTFEGFTMRKWIADEVGKYPVKQLFSYTEPALRKGLQRIGTPILFGTAGDITAEGADFKYMFDNADTFKLKQFFFGGWMGMLVDELGNDMVEDAIRWIIYERFKREALGIKDYTDFIQQYPLTIQEAFTSNEEYGVGDIFKIQRQMDNLTVNPPFKKHGYFQLNKDQKPIFALKPLGDAIIYEEPDPSMQDLYIGGVDTVDHESKNPESKDISGLCLYIMKKRRGTEPPKIVFEMYSRPKTPRDFYDQALLACLYYNDCRVMIERNKPGIIYYFEERGFKHLMATKPQSTTSLIAGTTWNIGVHIGNKEKMYGEECIAEYVQDYCEWIPSKELLREFLEYGQRNTDRASAFLVLMLYLKEDKWEASEKNDNQKFFGTKLVKGRDGIPRRVPSV